MAISVQDITATSAIITWLPMQKCVDTFYTLMYHPNWNSLLMGYTRKNAMQEDKIPLNQTTASLGNLIPQTSYVICVTCQSASPTRDQCQVFSTLDEGGELAGSHRDIDMALWLASTVLLLIISVLLLWGCLHSMWPETRNSVGECQPCPTPSNQDHRREDWEKEIRLPVPNHSEEDSQHLMVLENPFHTDYSKEAIDGQCHELWTLNRQSP
ncbi:fibronectin type III domain-containing protein 9 isoform X2 [Trichomycterus rosablanca]